MIELHETRELAIAGYLREAGLEGDENFRNSIVAVSEHTGIGVQNLVHGRPYAPVAKARKYLMYVLKHVHGYGYRMIAKLWGYDHTNIVKGLYTLNDWLEVDADMKEDLRVLLERVVNMKREVEV